MSHRITETPYTPVETEDWKRPEVCIHCGEAIGMHYQHADGRIVCVEIIEDKPLGATLNG